MRACSVMVIIDASQALDPGSIPGRRRHIRRFFLVLVFVLGLAPAPLGCTFADIAQLGERQTEDLKVPGSIPGVGTAASLW